MFTHAVVRRPGPDFAEGLTTAGLGRPDFRRMLGQHAGYLAVLRDLGLAVFDGQEHVERCVFSEHRAEIGPDQIGTTGLATKVNHGYLQAFAAAAAIGGLGGLAQIGNNGSVFTPSTEIRNGISQESAMEGEQVLNHFLNRLPIITLKEGSRPACISAPTF